MATYKHLTYSTISIQNTNSETASYSPQQYNSLGDLILFISATDDFNCHPREIFEQFLNRFGSKHMCIRAENEKTHKTVYIYSK